MPFQPVLKAFWWNLIFVGPGAGTETRHVHLFPDDHAISSLHNTRPQNMEHTKNTPAEGREHRKRQKKNAYRKRNSTTSGSPAASCIRVQCYTEGPTDTLCAKRALHFEIISVFLS